MKHFGYDYPKRDRSTIRQLCDLTDRHGCSVGRDTVKAILNEADPRTNCGRDRRNREKSYFKLIYAFAYQFCADGADGLSAKAAEKIANLVQDRDDTIQVEVVRKILHKAKCVVSSSL